MPARMSNPSMDPPESMMPSPSSSQRRNDRDDERHSHRHHHHRRHSSDKRRSKDVGTDKGRKGGNSRSNSRSSSHDDGGSSSRRRRHSVDSKRDRNRSNNKTPIDEQLSSSCHHLSMDSPKSSSPSLSPISRDQLSMQLRQSQPTSPSRGVTFADYDFVFEIPHINDIPESIVRDTYMSSDELASIRRECIGTVKKLNDGLKDGDLLRGLDQHTHKYTERKKGIDRRVYDAVFRIQEFQRKTGVDASLIMAKHCAIHSEPSVAAAHVAAISDVFSSFKGTWSERSIPNPQACSSNPTQGTFE